MATDTARYLREIPALTGTTPPFSASGWSSEPVAQFRRWLGAAIDFGVAEPHAAVLSTVDTDGMPDARTLLLKDFDGRGWAFAGPGSSAKGMQLLASPAAALTFWWQPAVRSVRIRGHVIEASREESEADFTARSAAAQAEVASCDWTLWRVVPDRVEFWQGAVDRRHFRATYLRDEGRGWRLTASRGAQRIQLDG